jgi:hypothetical protein
MGTVYLAADPQMRRFVAVKLLHAPGDPGAFERFRGEVRALAALAHPHIVTVFAADLGYHAPYYVMEFVPGGTLSRHVGARGPLAPGPAAALVATVARAVHAAHGCGIVHRDIKPGNVLLAGGLPAGGGGGGENPSAVPLSSPATGSPAGEPAPALVPKLSDFGLAKRIDRNEGLTVGHGALGTPGFMSPEQAAGAAVTARTDVYGLGATLYHALTGVAPFEGDNLQELVSLVQTTDPRRVRARRPDVPADLEAVVHKCLEKEPKDRYASAADLAADLDRFAAGRPVAARPLTALRRARKAVVVRRRLLGQAALAAMALTAVFVLGAALRGTPAAPEARALKEMRADLGAKKAVPLVGPAGPPLWHLWVHTPGEFAPDPGRDQVCSFRVFGRSMLDLCPDPMTDRYRVRAELSQADVDGRGPDGRPSASGPFQIGFYFGRQRATGAKGWHADVCMAVRFSETPANRAGRVSFGRLLLADSPTERRYMSDHSSHAAVFPAATALPGPWHVVEAEITPEGIRVWFDPNGTTSDPFAVVRAADLARAYAAPKSGLDKLAPDNGIALPAWDPRGALGVWSDSSSVALRNVTLSPLK